MRYVDQRGQAISLGKKLGAGGEGAVYEISGERQFVAKIYHQPAPLEKAHKLSLMARLAPPGISSFAAWPHATLHTRLAGPTVGLILPRIERAQEIHELYSPAHRKVHFPQADWRFLIRAARNCATAFDKLHHSGIVIGDVNQGNIFVTRDALVRLIDCDSFQFSAEDRLFRCPVGVAHFVPPELQGARLSEVTRTANHDNFGLAIVAFHLLFMGRHPFSGRYSGPGEMPIERAIREYRFAYSSQAGRYQMSPPPHSITLGHLPGSIAQLFERAFINGSQNPGARPTAAAWAMALEQLEANVRPCRYDPGHAYPSHLSDCPWCQIVGQGGPNFFIAVSIRSAIRQSAQFDLQAVWAAIEAVPSPDDDYEPPPRFPTHKLTPRPIPPPPTTNYVRPLLAAVTVITAALTPLGLWYWWIAAGLVPLSLFYGAWWLLLTLQTPRNRAVRERRQAVNAARSELKRTRDQQLATAHRALSAFDQKRHELEQAKTNYQKLNSQRAAAIQDLQHQLRQRQLDAHLQQCFLSDAHIPGIGPTRIAVLESYGIETALDISVTLILNVPGFGPELTTRLLQWRKRKESEFRYVPGRGVPQGMIDQVELKYAQLRQQYEQQLLRGPDELRKLSREGSQAVQKLGTALARLELEVAQRTVDLTIFEMVPWWK